ncbi:hypothetical protein L4D18_24285 [Vibrio campbellii]|uniref:hypothetical protein n=1 Tax=Vibrio campbellii TaxID=680 RepID=UPI003D1394BB
MEIYSDDNYSPENMKFSISGISFIMAMFQLVYTFFDAPYYSKVFCWSSLFIILFFQVYLFTKKGKDFLNKRVEVGVIFPVYALLVLTLYVLSSVIVGSNSIFDPVFLMFIFLVLIFLFGFISGAYFSDKSKALKNSVIVRGNEVEIRKLDIFGVLSLQRMPFLRAPLKKMRNALYVVVFFIGTGGAGIGMGGAELLKRSDIISPEIGVHSVLFFSLGVPVLFTFGVLIYSMVAYLLEWRKLIAGIEKEFGEHKIIFNSQKKSYKKIKDILDSRE